MRSKIAQIIESMKEEIAEMTCELIKFPTFPSTGSSYVECSRFISENLKEAGLRVEEMDVPRKVLEDLWGRNLEKSLEFIEVKAFSTRRIVLGKWSGSVGKPSLHLNNHYDLFDLGLTDRNPIVPSVREGKIFGKGASNPWAGFASMIMAVKALRRAGVELKGDLYVSATPDNHLGGESGAGYLVEKGYGKSDMVITAYPTGVDTITLGFKGNLWLEITAVGRTCHASQPDEGINAINKMMKLHKAICELDERFVREGIRSRWPIFPPESRRPTIVATRIETPGSLRDMNVPDRCVMYVDRRVIPEETMEGAKEEILGEIRKLEKEDRDFKADVRFIHTASNAVTPSESHLAKMLMGNIREILGIEPKTAVWPYYTDFRFFRSGWDAQTVNYSPGLPGVYNGPGEYVLLQDLVSATKVLALTVVDLLC